MSNLRVAIACPGVGLVQRGFERLFRDLYDEMKDELDVFLIKGGGFSSDREIVPVFLPRGGSFLRLLPIHKLVGRTAMHAECMTFALALIPLIRKHQIDVVHVIDPPLSRILHKLRARLKMNFRILYTEGTAMPPSDYPPCDRLHQISKATFDDAVDKGYPADKMSLIPCGIRLDRFDGAEDRAALREKYDVPENKFVILSVAALNREHKRTQHLIDEAAASAEDFLLWLDGSLDHGDPDLPDYARAKLGDRVRITHVESEDVGELYRLADMFAHAAGFEAFGLAIVEAAAMGLPTVTHNDPHFRWLLPQEACQIDMLEEGALRTRIEAVIGDRETLSSMQMQNYARETYGWDYLIRHYKELYLQVAGEPMR